MNRRFRVTLWINDLPFYHFCKTMMDVLTLVETSTGKYLSEEQRKVMIDVMVGMLMRDTDVECSLTAEDKQMRVSLAYIDPMKLAAIAG